MRIEVGDRFNLSAAQMILLCCKAIGDFCEAVRKDMERREDGWASCNPPDEMEYSRDAVCDWIEEHPDAAATAPCNTAKARKALEAVRDAFASGKIWPVGNHPSEEHAEEVGRIRKKVEEALAAPPRNCDIHGTHAEATEAIRKYLEGNESRRLDTDFAHWVFETEGELDD